MPQTILVPVLIFFSFVLQLWGKPVHKHQPSTANPT